MRLQTVQDALNQKNIRFEYTEEDGCGSLDFMFRGLKFHVWEYHDGVWGAETNIYEAGRSEDIEGDYEEKIAGEILSWPDMIDPAGSKSLAVEQFIPMYFACVELIRRSTLVLHSA